MTGIDSFSTERVLTTFAYLSGIALDEIEFEKLIMACAVTVDVKIQILIAVLESLGANSVKAMRLQCKGNAITV
ncbi:hypothetical protein PRBRB14_23610 [Hallella multisaccharivorax DSM 17128]|nr:hypothetical protein PRBRB14_23610 [Hallella multisaccharivorax DSM 17128]